MELEEGQVVLCTVEKVVGTTVFVKIEGYGEGTIITSEIAPGRIRNLRDYVVPNKKIVCKVLRIDQKGHIDLSLRRVTTKEKKQVLEAHKKEKSFKAVLKTVMENAENTIEKITKKTTLVEFFEEVKENPELLDKFLTKQEKEKLLKILSERKEKEVSVKKIFKLSSEAGDGIIKIKKVLPSEATYLAAGKFSITIKNSNYKDANHKIDDLLKEIEQKAKKENLQFSLADKK